MANVYEIVLLLQTCTQKKKNRKKYPEEIKICNCSNLTFDEIC